MAAVLAPIVIAAYLSDSHSSPEALAAAHAEIGRIVARALGPTAA